MYRKVLIPMDGSSEAEGVFDKVKEEIAPNCEVILLHVIPPGKTYIAGKTYIDSSCRWPPVIVLIDGRLFPGTQEEDIERSKAMSQLNDAANRLGGGSDRYRSVVAVAKSVPGGIADTADREEVDLIAMYTHDRKGITKLIQRSIAKDVQRRARMDVKVFKPPELVGIA